MLGSDSIFHRRQPQARSMRVCPRTEFKEEGQRKSTHFSYLLTPYPLRVNSPSYPSFTSL